MPNSPSVKFGQHVSNADQDSVSKFLTERLVTQARLLLPEPIPEVQTHEGKQVFSINPIGTVWEQGAALLREGMGGILPKSKFPDAS